MNKMISKLLVSLAVVCGFGMNAQAGELAKSGEFSGLGFYDGKVLGMFMKGKAPALIQAEYYGGSMNHAGSGLFHNGSYKCNFAIEVIQMPQTEGIGFCVYKDADGDLSLIHI